jgi:ribonuclease BN (tRNA processing enzyme)
VELIVLGSAPAYTDRSGSAASSYLLRIGSAALVLDLGQGSLANLAATVEPSTLTAILVSHLHPDHFVDLVPLRHYLKWEFTPARRLGVLGPAGLAGRVDSLNGEPGFAAEALDMEPLAEGIRRIGPFDVAVRSIPHTEESYAFRVAPGGSNGEAPAPGLVYSGDCSRADDLLPLIRRGDTLLAEATFGAGPVAPGAQHITSGDAARVAASGGAARMLLTHILSGHSRQDTLDAACAAFSGPVRLVTEGDRFEI